MQSEKVSMLKAQSLLLGFAAQLREQADELLNFWRVWSARLISCMMN